MNDGAKAAGFVAILILAVIVGIFAIKAHYAWENNCEDQGGHVTKHTSWDSNMDTTTTYYCLNADGGIISIR
jgi:hypothetical protein